MELFACTFAGTDHVPVETLADRWVAVTNAGGIHAPGIAEQVLGNCLLTPHTGGHTPKHWDRLADIVARTSSVSIRARN